MWYRERRRPIIRFTLSVHLRIYPFRQADLRHGDLKEEERSLEGFTKLKKTIFLFWGGVEEEESNSFLSFSLLVRCHQGKK